jgi:hypothetical protein
MKNNDPWEWGWQAVGSIVAIVALALTVFFARHELAALDRQSAYLLVGLATVVILFVLYIWRRLQRRETLATPAEPLTPDALQNPRNRENLLNSVQTAWIDGVYHKSIHGEIIKLYLTHKPDAVGLRLWGLALKQAGKKGQHLPTDYDLGQLFAKSGRNLLILGQPGSGKTFTLLQLAEFLLTEARRDPAAPLPIILNLSSWAQEKRPLADWLVEELFIQYSVTRHVARAGIAHNQFLYLLDGLDEVAAAVRDDCVTAVNTFKAAHPAEMVICSRSEEYGALKEGLKMGTAVEIQPLTPDQIDHYLSQEGLQLQAVQTTLKTDPDLRELAETPLMLNIMTLAYQGEEKIDLRPRAGKEARCRHIYDHYIAKNFKRRPFAADSPHTQEQALRWLANLACGMTQHEQSVFYTEKLQPTWLGNGRWRRAYQLFIGLLVGSFCGLLVRQISGDLLGLIVGSLFGFLLGNRQIEPREILVLRIPNWRGVRSQLKDGLLLGSFVGMLTALFFMVISGDSAGLVVRLIIGLLVGLFFALFFGLLGALMNGLISGLPQFIGSQAVAKRLHPNEAVYNSGFNGLRWGLVTGLVVGLIFGPVSGLTLGLFVALVLFGGLAVVQHYSLRWLLARAGILPYSFGDCRLVAFLDALCDRNLLRRVGSGWIFVHRLLLEHFATLPIAK